MVGCLLLIGHDFSEISQSNYQKCYGLKVNVDKIVVPSIDEVKGCTQKEEHRKPDFRQVYPESNAKCEELMFQININIQFLVIK